MSAGGALAVSSWPIENSLIFTSSPLLPSIDHGSSTGIVTAAGRTWIIIVAVVAGVLVIAALSLFLISRRNRGRKDAPVNSVEAETVVFTGDTYIEELECENPLSSDDHGSRGMSEQFEITMDDDEDECSLKLG
jgi:hypothetical protein